MNETLLPAVVLNTAYWVKLSAEDILKYLLFFLENRMWQFA